MHQRDRLATDLLTAAHDRGWPLSIGRAYKLVSRHLNEPDPVAYCLTYPDPVGEQATNRAMCRRRTTC